MDEKIKGVCTQMCPEDEMKLRERERLLHPLEIVPGTQNHRRPEADRTRAVKAYSRSAAGQSMQVPKNLRTPDTLLKTINYLLYDVITTKELPWHVVYDFITDRLLAIRQDMVIQRLPTAHCISILQPIIRFHAYAAYRLCEEPISRFDPVTNNRNLQECLKRLLVLYDGCDRFAVNLSSVRNATINIKEYEALYTQCRAYMEALYVLFNLGDANAIDRALTLPNRYKTQDVKTALNISLCMLRGNWVKLCQLLPELPTILAGVAALHLPGIRRNALRVMTVAYSSKNLTFPARKMQELLLYSKLSDLLLDCEHYGILYVEKSEGIRLEKGKFDASVKVCPPRRETFATEKLYSRNITGLVLYGEVS